MLKDRLLLFYTGLGSISENVLREQKANTEKSQSTRKDIEFMVDIANNLKKDLELHLDSHKDLDLDKQFRFQSCQA